MTFGSETVAVFNRQQSGLEVEEIFTGPGWTGLERSRHVICCGDVVKGREEEDFFLY